MQYKNKSSHRRKQFPVSIKNERKLLMVLSAVITCNFIPAAKNSGKTVISYVKKQAVTTRRAENLKAFYYFGITLSPFQPHFPVHSQATIPSFETVSHFHLISLGNVGN